MPTCEHEILEIVTEPFLQGLDDYIGTECINCFTYLEVPYELEEN